MKMPAALPLPRTPGSEAPPRAVAHRAEKAELVERFDVHQRVQHILMASSFIVLTLTGLPQKFDDLGVSQALIGLLGGLDSVRAIHHVAAFVMLFDCAYHAAYLVAKIVKDHRLASLGMVATPQDFRDVWQQLLHLLGLSRTKPRFGRFSYLEKFDYWAVFWGIAIIGGSGLVLMFPVVATRVLPGFMVQVAFVAHSDEAVLAVGWIFLVHFFYVHVFHGLNTSIFTGKISKRAALRDHPRWIARLTEDASKDG
jgi:formate dehydrogenase subunit gamma